MPCTSCNRSFEERPNDMCVSVTHWRAYAENLETRTLKCEHVWQDFGDYHECSYVDCYCDHPCCIKCGVCIDDIE